jgi:hypothetical protein
MMICAIGIWAVCTFGSPEKSSVFVRPLYISMLSSNDRNQQIMAAYRLQPEEVFRYGDASTIDIAIEKLSQRRDWRARALLILSVMDSRPRVSWSAAEVLREKPDILAILPLAISIHRPDVIEHSSGILGTWKFSLEGALEASIQELTSKIKMHDLTKAFEGCSHAVERLLFNGH